MKSVIFSMTRSVSGNSALNLERMVAVHTALDDQRWRQVDRLAAFEDQRRASLGHGASVTQ
jgi:hypothetical protein